MAAVVMGRSFLFALPPGCLSVGILAAEANIISLGGGTGKQLYQFDQHRIERGGGIFLLFRLPKLLALSHACTVTQGRASFPRGILAQNRHCLSAVPADRRVLKPRRPGARVPQHYRAADDLQIDQRVAALDRARRAAIQIVPSPVTQAPQLEIAEV
jgi:hypothetical protein